MTTRIVGTHRRSRLRAACPGPVVAIVLAVAVAGGCVRGELVPTGGPTPVADASPPPVLDLPPSAILLAEGGEVGSEGQLGTYTWNDQGSDSPWLRGTPFRVAAGVGVRVLPVGDERFASWTARLAPAADRTGETARSVGRGRGVPSLRLPAGSWVLQLHAVFEGGMGEAAYYWALTVE